jgi:hypothetical protein
MPAPLFLKRSAGTRGAASMQDTLPEGFASATQLAPSAVTASAVGGSVSRSVVGRVSPRRRAARRGAVIVQEQAFSPLFPSRPTPASRWRRVRASPLCHDADPPQPRPRRLRWLAGQLACRGEATTRRCPPSVQYGSAASSTVRDGARPLPLCTTVGG